MTKHAVFANCRVPGLAGETRATFRVGQPTDLTTAGNRWYRLDNRRTGWEGVPKRPVFVQYGLVQWPVHSLEVRAVDSDGTGLGSERHARAIRLPYRAVRSALRVR